MKAYLTYSSFTLKATLENFIATFYSLRFLGNKLHWLARCASRKRINETDFIRVAYFVKKSVRKESNLLSLHRNLVRNVSHFKQFL